MTDKDLYSVYAGWTGSLHHWVQKHLGRHIDCEYFPSEYVFRIYSGQGAQKELAPWGFSTVPAILRPAGEAKATITLPKPQDNPTPEQLDDVFKAICLAAASILEIELAKPKLPDSNRGTTPQLRRLKNRKK
jgi:hypothetical protein